MIDPDPIRGRFSALSSHLDERERRLLAATEARAAGYGGIAAVSQATGIAVSTIGRGLKELAAPTTLAPGRVRRAGGGRKPVVVSDPTVLADLMALVEPDERGDPMSPLRWTCKSLRQLSAELMARGHRISRTVVGELLKRQKFSLQGNSKTQEGGDHPDRDAQFAHINQSVTVLSRLLRLLLLPAALHLLRPPSAGGEAAPREHRCRFRRGGGDRPHRRPDPPPLAACTHSAARRDALMAWCEANRVDYVFGLARNERLEQALTSEVIAATIESGPIP
jgi:Rhodopirellula transposase DDE domain